MKKFIVIAAIAALFIGVAAATISGPTAFSAIPLNRQVSAVIPITDIGPATLPNGSQVNTHYVDLSTTDKALIISNIMLWGYSYELYVHVEINGLVTRTVYHAKNSELITPVVIPPGSACRVLFYGLSQTSLPAGWVSITGYALYPSEFN